MKNELSDLKSHVETLAQKADKLKNKNLRDIVKSGLAKIAQALDHPDIDLVHDEENRKRIENGDVQVVDDRPRTAFDAMDPGRNLQAQEAHRREVLGNEDGQKPFNFDNKSGGGDPNVLHPGDPKFAPENNNPGFQDPHNVDLNKDGTLQRAPNAFSHEDKRD